MKAYTTGQWNCTKTISDDITIYADTDDNKGAGKDIALVYKNSRSIPMEEAEANAKVMAASKDLLEALQATLDDLMEGNLQGESAEQTISQIQAAINKAIQ